MLSPQLCPTLCSPMDCSPPGSCVHGDSPGKNTELGCHAILQGIFPTQPRDWTQVSHIAGRSFTIWATREAQTLAWWFLNAILEPSEPWVMVAGSRPSRFTCQSLTSPWAIPCPQLPSNDRVGGSWGTWLMSLCCEVLDLEHCWPTWGPLAVTWGRLMWSKCEGSQVQGAEWQLEGQRHRWLGMSHPGLAHSCSLGPSGS